MAYPTNAADVKKGQLVEIENDEGHFVVKVESVLTSNQNFKGVKVRSDDGRVGRVRSFVQNGDLMETFQKNLGRPEGQKLEFKASFLFDFNRYNLTRDVEPNVKVPHSIAKTIAAFANSDGGTLYIGVADDKQILGLNRDYDIVRKYNKQKKDLKFDTGKTITLDSNGEFSTTLYRTMAQLFVDKFDYNEAIDLEILRIDNKDVCAITVKPSKRPLILECGKGGKREFYVRYTDQSEPYHDMARFCEYWCDHLRGLSD